MLAIIKLYLYHWYLENKLTLIIIGGLIGFVWYLDYQYKKNYHLNIKPKSPLENLEEQLRHGKIDRLNYEKRKIKLMQK